MSEEKRNEIDRHLQREWDNNFNSLLLFKQKFDHCDVPKQWRENLKLGTWVHAQRRAYRKGFLETDRIQKLETVGFHWSRTRL